MAYYSCSQPLVKFLLVGIGSRKIAIKFSAMQNAHHLNSITAHLYSNAITTDTNAIPFGIPFHRLNTGDVPQCFGLGQSRKNQFKNLLV